MTSHSRHVATINKLKQELKERMLQITMVTQRDPGWDPNTPFDPSEIWDGPYMGWIYGMIQEL